MTCFFKTSQTPTNLRQGVDPFYEIMQDRFRGVDASIAGQVANASRYTQDKTSHQPTTKPLDHDQDLDMRSNSSLWSDEDEEQMIVDQQQRPHAQARKLSRYLSTVNRSLLDRPSDLIADFYISQLNRNMQEGVRHVETIARDKALMRQDRNREFIDEPTSKLGRSLSAEHLYQVRKEHLRYKQPFATPTSFTAEDVADIYKPFALENYKRKIAIELERRRRERQGQLMGSTASPSMYTSDSDFARAIRSSQPPIIEPPSADRQHRLSNLSRTSIVRTNELGAPSFDSDQRRNMFVVRPPMVQTKEIVLGRARRTLTDDGSADVVHHIGIVSPPPAYLMDQQPSPHMRTTISTSTSNQFEYPQVITIPPPDFADRQDIVVRKRRLNSHPAQPSTDDQLDTALTTTQPILIKDDDYDPSLRIPVQVKQKNSKNFIDKLNFSLQIITTTESEIITSRRPQAKIYTPIAQTETVQICQADRTETDSGNYDLSMANVRSIVTLNQGEINEINFLAQQAQRLQLPPHDYDRAMIVLSPEHRQYQHQIGQQPLLLAAATVGRLQDEHPEYVTQHVDHARIQPQRTQLIDPIAEHMAKVEEDIPVFENIASANISQPSRNRLNEIAHDSGIVSLSTSQTSEQPLVLNRSHMPRLEHTDEPHLESLHEDDYYRRRIRALDLLRQVDTDPNTNIPPIHQQPVEIFEHTTTIPPSDIPPARTRLTDTHRFDQIQTLEHTDVPIIYESTDRDAAHRIPQREKLRSSEVDQDNQTRHRAEENRIQWGQRTPIDRYQITEIRSEETKPLIEDTPDRRDTAQSRETTPDSLERTQPGNKSIIYGYGKYLLHFSFSCVFFNLLILTDG